LAVAPGKREIGIAIFVGADLIYESVKTIKRRKPVKLLLAETTGILEKLFQGFSIKMVVTKTISQYQKLSPDLEKIVERIKLESEQRNLPVVEISLEQIKSVLCKNEKATEKRAFETLLVSYPQLEKYWNRPNKWQNDYYAFLFSAVAVGVVYLKTFSDSENF
jgi:hypothetical protein